jgi:glycosyltransferase involved in cell wall biosynthesis
MRVRTTIMQKPLVSIVMPVYNAEKYLGEAIGSLISQKYNNIEIICVDDGSTDNSVSLIEHYKKIDNRIILIKQKNLHAGIARNTGLSIAKGEYVIFLDSDDIFEKDLISSLVDAIQKHDVEMIIFNYYTFSGNIRFRKKQEIKYAGEEKKQSELTDDIFHMTIGAPWNKFYKMDFVKKCGIEFQGTLNSNDIYFTRLTSALASKIYFLDKKLVNYRINNVNSLQGNVNKSSDAYATAILGIYDKLEELGMLETYRDAAVRYSIDLCMTALEKIRSESDFKLVYNACNRIANKIELEGNCEYLKNKGIDSIFKKIIDEDQMGAAIQLCLYEKTVSVNRTCIEYRIGKKILTTLKIKNY